MNNIPDFSYYSHLVDTIKMTPKIDSQFISSISHIDLKNIYVLQALLDNDSDSYLLLPPKIQNDKQCCILYLKHTYNTSGYGSHFDNIPLVLIKDEGFLSEYIDLTFNSRHILSFFKYLFKVYKDDMPLHILKKGLEEEGTIIQYANDIIKNNKELALIAVINNGFSLSHVSEELRNDYEVVQEAILQTSEYYHTVWNLAGKKIRQEIGSQNPYEFFAQLKSKSLLKKELEENLIENTHKIDNGSPSNIIHHSISKKQKI